MLNHLYNQQKQAYDAQRNRDICLGVLAGFWVYSFLDAIIMFPDYGINISGANLGLYPGSRGDGVRVVGTVKF